MKAFDYQVIDSYGGEQLEKKLADAGNEGWELVAVTALVVDDDDSGYNGGPVFTLWLKREVIA